MQKTFAAIIITIFLTIPCISDASIVLDQVNQNMYTSMVGTNHYQQEVTVGYGGILSYVDLYTSAGSVNLRLATGSAVQTGGWLFDQAVSLVSGWNHIDVSAANMIMDVGDMFVIDWLGATGSPLLGISFNYYTYQGYADGYLWRIPTTGAPTNNVFGTTQFDLLFRTYMADLPVIEDPVAAPEPGTVALLALGGLGLVVFRKRIKSAN